MEKLLLNLFKIKQDYIDITLDVAAIEDLFEKVFLFDNKLIMIADCSFVLTVGLLTFFKSYFTDEFYDSNKSMAKNSIKLPAVDHGDYSNVRTQSQFS